MWRADSARSATTDQTLSPSLELHWSLSLPVPLPAWPAEQGKVRFDASYEPIVSDGRMFVPSMVHDSLTAYRITDGRRLWSVYVDGPVRFAPVALGDVVLFVSDDGHLYCVRADDGELVWKLRGGPTDRLILGNDRLISMWPARGAPVTYGDTVYFAAGIWPFMGIFVHAVDIPTGQVLWTNSGTGSNYTVQQHNSPAFAGVAPQGYLAVNDKQLLVSGGMTVPAVFDRTTGKLLYYQPSDRTFGKDVGGYEVVLGPDWFSNRGVLHLLADGQPRVQSPASIYGPQCAIGIAGKHLVAHGNAIVQYAETSIDKKGKETKTVKYRVDELWRARLPQDVTKLHVQTGQQLLASDDRSRIVLLNIPTATDQECQIAWEGTVDGTIWRMLVSDGRLFVVTQEGGIFCFGEGGLQEGSGQLSAVDELTGVAAGPASVTSPPAVGPREDREPWSDASSIVQQLRDPTGYSVIDRPPNLTFVRQLVQQTQMHCLVTQPDPQLRRQWREQLADEGLLGRRIALLPASLDDLTLPPYMANLIVSCARDLTALESVDGLTRLFEILRPYSGTAMLAVDSTRRDHVRSVVSATTTLSGTVVGDYLVIQRDGPLAGSGTWTSQNGDAGNSLVSAEHRVKTPLGLLWFGGPSNRDVLPRHGHGPTPQVIGGRLFIEGRDMLRAVDVYTGRLLWQRAFQDVGIFYDNTDHHPGAGAIGGNYVSTSDSVYLIWQRSCLRLDPVSGATLVEYQLPADESHAQPYWGYVAVSGDYLIAGSSPMLLHTRGPGEKTPAKNEVRDVPLYSQFGEGSRRLVIMNRHSGQVVWTREAKFNFRHNAIAVGDGRVYCLDRMTETRLAYYRRRGETPATDFCLYALDLATGAVIWSSSEQAFGTWLGYQAQAKILVQAGSKNRDRAEDEVGQGLAAFDSATGKLLWSSDVTYGGPPLLYPDTIITQGTAFDLRTGEPRVRRHPLTDEPLPWQFARNYGCNTAIGCVNLLTFRSAAAGYFDLEHDGGTGNLGGFRSSCTSNLIAADGVLSAPDYTRTCTCSYQNQCSLAMIPLPEVEMWTFNPLASSGRRVRRLGINFGAPGDRRTEAGTLWLDFPSVGGPSPDVPLLLSPDPLANWVESDETVASDPTAIGSLEYFRQHASNVPAIEPRWVFASGVRGARNLRIRLASQEEAGGKTANYRVRLFLRTSPAVTSSAGEVKVTLQGQVHDGWTMEQCRRDFEQGGIRQYESIPVGEFLDLQLTTISSDTAGSSQPLPLDLCGLEVELIEP